MVLVLEPKQIQNLVTLVSNASRRILEQAERRPVLICGPALRLPLFRLIEQFDTHVHILSYAELSPDFNIQVMETMPELWQNAGYVEPLPEDLKQKWGVSFYPYHSFVLERLFSYYCHVNKSKLWKNQK